MIKAITFDLDGVYFLNGKTNFMTNLKLGYGINEDEAKRVFLKSDEMNNVYKKGLWTDEQYWNWAIGEWKIKAEPGELTDLLIAGYEDNPPVLEVIQKLKAKGYKILACSNNFPARVNGLDERFGFLQNFDTAVFSYQVGATKPEAKIFETLIEKSGCKASEIVMSDDDEKNLVEAKNLGINTFVYQNFEQFEEELKKLGVEW